MENQELIGTKLWIIRNSGVRAFITIDRVTKTQAISADYLRFKLPLSEYNTPIGERYSYSNYCLETPEILDLYKKTIALDEAIKNIDELKVKWLNTDQLQALNLLLNSFKTPAP